MNEKLKAEYNQYYIGATELHLIPYTYEQFLEEAILLGDAEKVRLQENWTLLRQHVKTSYSNVAMILDKMDFLEDRRSARK